VQRRKGRQRDDAAVGPPGIARQEDAERQGDAGPQDRAQQQRCLLMFSSNP
jgi:hypothetical protein